MAKQTKSAKIPIDDQTDQAETIEVTKKPANLDTGSPELSAAPEVADDVEDSKPSEPEDQLDAETDKAVDDIIAQDTQQETDDTQEPSEPGPKPSRLMRGLKAFWRHKKLAFVSLILALITTAIVPAGRYFALNTVGVRSTASLTVLDDSTQQPLKNVEVQLANQTATTDKAGKVTFRSLRLGKAKLAIHKRAFASSEQWLTIGWGSNPLKPVSLKPTGSQYRFMVTDYLSGKPIADVEAVSGEASAISDGQGELKLTLEPNDEKTSADITFTAAGLRSETIRLDLTKDAVTDIKMVPARSHLFISKRSGRYDVYKVDADGQNEEKVLAGSGVERDDLALVSHPTKDFAVLVSTRENVRRNNFLLSTLTLIDVAEKTPTKLAQSERIQIVDWVGDRLIYVQIAAGASAVDPQRHRLMSYDLSTNKSTELAAANYFNDVLVVGGQVYYAPSAAYSETPMAFYKVKPDGSDKKTALNEEVWNVFRSDYDKLVLATATDWYEHTISTSQNRLLASQPSALTSRIYIDSPDGKHSLWVDQRDGKGVLLNYNITAKTESILHRQSGLSNPVFWLNDSSLVFRVKTSSETADYVMSINGGEPKKLKNVTNTSGVDNWYYY